MTLLICICAVLFGCAFFDGWSTLRAIKKGWVEVNKLLVWLYGTNKPNNIDEYVYGSLIICAEAALALCLSHLYPSTKLFFEGILAAQSAGHIVAGVHNLKA